MEGPVVKMQAGAIRGSVENHEEGFNYYAFKGIPYAEPPIGQLRFKDPVPKKSWPGVLNCKKYAPILMQQDWYQGTTSTNEDGLYLNVFTRVINEPKTKKKPVMIVIHGGGYISFSGNDFYTGAEYLIRKDLVVVTINYRLGVLGFLNVDHKVAPGNQGLKDQILALRWIQKNIKMFGGDPNNVTAYGASGGATAVHYLALSPLSKGLFHKVISQSSVAFNYWAMVKNPKLNAIKLCSILGKELTDSKEIVDFLRSVDTEALLEAQQTLIKTIDEFSFGPSTDSKSSNPFMPTNFISAANECVHLPYLVGYAAREGLLALHEPFLFKGKPREEIFQEINRDHSLLFTYNGDQVLERYNLNPSQFKRLYYKSEIVSCDNLDKFVDFMGDLHFVEGIHRFARVQAQQSSASTYLYVFDYDGPDLISKKILKNVPTGASHMDDTPFVLKMKFFEELGIDYFKKGTKSYRVMEQMTEMWANFAKYGRPTVGTSDLITVNWLPIADGTLLRYLSVDEDLLMKSMVNVNNKLLAAKNIKI